MSGSGIYRVELEVTAEEIRSLERAALALDAAAAHARRTGQRALEAERLADARQTRTVAGQLRRLAR